MKTRSDLTFKHNQSHGRHGWLRLTPAYSVKVVHQILDEHPDLNHILDPFAGTATTGLVASERGLSCDLLDINPFLVWFARAKTANYSDVEEGRTALRQFPQLFHTCEEQALWLPDIHNIERWWTQEKQQVLARLYRTICTLAIKETSRDLLLIAFCRKLIEWSNAAFNHQSMSFKVPEATLPLFEYDPIADFIDTGLEIMQSASVPLSGTVKIMEWDARNVPQLDKMYDGVITSPPYPNRMSYIRELRPYMYWLGYLKEAREAGELDWKAIGGTWGIATSRVAQWTPTGIEIPYNGFTKIIKDISCKSPLLANYVHKYFEDVALHLGSLYPTVAKGGKVFYVIGNSKFFDTVLPVEAIYMALLRQAGFDQITTTVLRKRNSKKELYEYVVQARKP
jgi:hypothetical protein